MLLAIESFRPEHRLLYLGALRKVRFAFNAKPLYFLASALRDE